VINPFHLCIDNGFSWNDREIIREGWTELATDSDDPVGRGACSINISLAKTLNPGNFSVHRVFGIYARILRDGSKHGYASTRNAPREELACRFLEIVIGDR